MSLCDDSGNVYYNYSPFNGHDYVDLGLPSGTLWATMNVGASKPSDYGQYFQWGDTSGYTTSQIGKDKQFDLANYKWYLSGGVPNVKFTKYTTNGATLKLEDDAAHANMGGEWHMPSPTQIRELVNSANTTSAWTTQDGVNGMKLTSKKDLTKSIFIPAEGYALNTTYYLTGGFVWSSMLGENNVLGGQHLYFDSDDVSLQNDILRYFGCSVRGVIG